MIKDRIEMVRENIARICRKIGRDPAEITLVGVTKFATVADIKEAIAAGLKDIGENKVQAAREKFPELEGFAPVTRHMIGHLQSNKVKLALELFDFIQSVDSYSVAAEIQKLAEKQGRTVDILLQVDCSGEEQKFGVPKAEAEELLLKICDFSCLRVQGLMTIAPFVEDQAVIRDCFRDLRLLSERLTRARGNQERLQLKYLSMGMTHDYETALEEGANMLRIGTAIFSSGQEQIK